MSDKTTPNDTDEPVSPEQERPALEEMARREKDAEVEIFDGVRGQDGGPVLPVRLQPQDMFCFSCHRGVSCWNKCCYGTDVTLTPHCILRLSRRFELRPAEFLARYTVPGIWEKAGLPVAKLKMGGAEGKGPCIFLHEEDGCTVYEDRPATCRYYPLGLAAIKLRDSDDKAKFHFLVKEPHCKGHEEDKLQSVEQFRREQEVQAYDEVNEGWMDILMKMASWKTVGGPQGKDVSAETKKMFYMVSTDVEAFRRFVFETKFLQVYEIDPESFEVLKFDDFVLLKLGFDWLKNVLFNEPTVSLRESVLKEAIAATRNEMGAT
jgi:Fe-S-cluster containining protein